jgi:hypothetical protein
VISIQIDISTDQVEDALVDLATWADSDFLSLIAGVVERIGDPEIAKDLIGKLGDTYTYLKDVFDE